MVFVLCGSLKMHVETSLLRECHRAGPCMVSYGPTGQRVQFPSTNAADKAWRHCAGRRRGGRPLSVLRATKASVSLLILDLHKVD